MYKILILCALGTLVTPRREAFMGHSLVVDPDSEDVESIHIYVNSTAVNNLADDLYNFKKQYLAKTKD